MARAVESGDGEELTIVQRDVVMVSQMVKGEERQGEMPWLGVVDDIR